MRPIKLTIQAFGPYKEKTTLDFTDLGQQNLFLVTGPTGAGKTTIFDAIVYALYGKTSGSSRDINELKSQLADGQDVAYVELTFLIHGQTYTIKRLPKQFRPTKTGLIREQNSEVSLIAEEFSLTKTQEVDAKIIEILGLTAEQFRQIVMLPQGEFKKLLEASSAEKETILRSIFHTKYIEYFQQTVADRYKAASQEVGVLKQQLDNASKSFVTYAGEGLVDDAGEENVESLSEKDLVQTYVNFADYEKLNLWASDRLTLFTQEIEKLNDEIEKDEESIQGLKNQMTLLDTAKTLSEQKEVLAGQAEEIDQLTSLYQQYEATREPYSILQQISHVHKQVDQVQQSRNASQKNYDNNHHQLEVVNSEITEWKDRIDQLPHLRDQVQELAVQQSKWQAYQANLDKLMKSQESAKQFEIQIADLEAKEAAAKTQVTQLDQALAESQKGLLEKGDLSDKSLALQNKTSEYQYQLKAYNQLAEEFEQLKTVKEEVATAQANYTSASQYSNDLEYQYQQNMAGNLASQLTEGQPCIVCGSTHHPSPAHLQFENVTKEMVDQAMKQSQDQFATYARLAESLRARNQRVDETLYQNSAYEEGLSQEGQLRNWFNKLDQSYQELEHLRLNLDQEKQTKQALENKVNEETNQLNQAKTALQQVQNQLAALNGQATTNQATIQQLTDELTYSKNALTGDSLEAVAKEYQAKQAAVVEISNKNDSLNAAYNQLVTTLGKLETEITSYNQQEAQLLAQEKDYQGKLTKLLENRDESTEDIVAIHESETDWKGIDAEIKQYENEVYALNSRLKDNQAALEAAKVDQDRSYYEEELISQQGHLADLRKDKDELISTKAQLNQLLEGFDRDLHDYMEKGTHYGELERLNQVANGKVKDYGYISFERYVLGLYFDEILTYANDRLMEMTQQRYEFRRITEGQAGAGAKGLDLAVFDYQSGGQRSVQSLSGGEGFKASLALALGLSDVIQNEAGGIEIGTLFVDEGFGTLDQESLQQAIETLTDLQQESGRIVGIISHVDELKQQIPVHLQVATSNQGSKAFFTGIQ